jgi:hypothetical protein
MFRCTVLNRQVQGLIRVPSSRQKTWELAFSCHIVDCFVIRSYSCAIVGMFSCLLSLRGSETLRPTKPLCGLCGHEKKFKKHQNCKFGINEIKYLQLLIFAKRERK